MNWRKLADGRDEAKQVPRERRDLRFVTAIRRISAGARPQCRRKLRRWSWQCLIAIVDQGRLLIKAVRVSAAE
jgi:hypothetical protein